MIGEDSAVGPKSAGNVIPTDDLPPISAALLAQKLIVTHHRGNGVFKMTQLTAQSAKKTGQNNSTARKESIERAALESFAQAVRGHSSYPVTLDQAINGVAVLEAVAKSAISGKTTRIRP